MFGFLSGVNYNLPNVPDLFESGSWNSLTKNNLGDNELTDQLAGLGINDQPAKHPGMWLKGVDSPAEEMIHKI